MQIDVRIEGLEKLQAGIASGPATLATEVRTAMVAGSLLIEGTQREEAPKDTGRLAGSIHYVISGGGANLTSKIGPSVAYGLYAAKGRGPGKAPPIGAIAGWAARHGINPYVLARSIARKGTKGKDFVTPSLTRNSGRIVALFSKVGGTVVSKMAG